MSWIPAAGDLLVMKPPVLEKVLRTVVVYFSLVTLLRIFGKRELAQLNPFDLVVLLMLSNTVQNAIIGDDNSLLGGLTGAVTLLVTNYLVVRFLFKHRRLDALMAGSPAVLIHKGKLVEGTLAKEMMNTAELTAGARKQGFDSLGEVEECVLEPAGVLSFTGKEPKSEDRRHKELMTRLDQLSAEIAKLQGRQGK